MPRARRAANDETTRVHDGDTAQTATSVLLEFMYRLAQAQIACGEQTARIELLLRRIASAYGMRRSRIVVFPTAVFITLHDGAEERVTLSRARAAPRPDRRRVRAVCSPQELGRSSHARARTALRRSPARGDVARWAPLWRPRGADARPRDGAAKSLENLRRRLLGARCSACQSWPAGHTVHAGARSGLSCRRSFSNVQRIRRSVRFICWSHHSSRFCPAADFGMVELAWRWSTAQAGRHRIRNSFAAFGLAAGACSSASAGQPGRVVTQATAIPWAGAVAAVASRRRCLSALFCAPAFVLVGALRIAHHVHCPAGDRAVFGAEISPASAWSRRRSAI